MTSSNNNKFKSKLASLRIAQKWLDWRYPKNDVYQGEYDKKNKDKRREEIEELKIKNEFLKGSLDLRDFVNLKKLDCSDNEIISLNVEGLNGLEVLNCSKNELSGLDLSENTELKFLDCHDNQIKKINLSNSIKLETLYCQEQKDNSLEEIIGLDRLRKLILINSSYFSLINQLGIRIDKARALLTGSDEYNYNSLLNREVAACQTVTNASLEDMPQENKDQAQQEQEAYEARIEQVTTWLQQK